MIEIQAPNGDVVTFPPDTPEETILRVMRENYPSPTPQRAAPVSPSGWLPTALARGVGDLVGTPADIGNLALRAVPMGIDALAERGMIPRALMPSVPGATQAMRERADAPSFLPTSERAGNYIMGQLGIQPGEAQTSPGRLAEGAVRFGAGSLMGLSVPGVLRNVGMGVLAGLTSSGAGEVTSGTSAEPYARVAGAFVPAVGGGVLNALRASTVSDAARALEGVTRAQMDQAQRLMAEAQAMGSPLTLPEAVQQVTGGNRSLRAAQDVAQTAAGGQRVMNPFLDTRNAGARQAAEQFAQTYAPPGSQAAMIPSRISDAAQAEVSGAYSARTRAVAPLYAQAAQDADLPGVRIRVRGIAHNAMTRLEGVVARDQSGLLAPQFEQMAQSFRAPFDPVNPVRLDWESLQDARRFYRDALRQQAVPGQPVIDRRIAREGLAIINDMTADLQRAVPSLRAADNEYIRLTREVVEPVERGIVGRVAQTENADAQRALLFPRDPMGGAVPTTPGAARDAFGQIAGTGPQTLRQAVGVNDLANARGLLGVELQTRLNEAFQTRASGATERAGAAAAARLVPTEGRQDALLASFRALPGGDQAADGFARLMNVLEAQQFAPPSGSQTATRTEALQRAGGGPRAAVNPVSEAKRIIEDWSRNANTEALARAITTPEGFNMLRAMAGLDNQARVEALAARLLTLDRARRAGSEPGE